MYSSLLFGFSFQSHTSIKTMTPVTDDLIAVATDLPLDHLIYQSHQDSPRDLSLTKPPKTLVADDHVQTSEFSLIIPNERIVQNPIAEMFEETRRPQDPLIESISEAEQRPQGPLIESISQPECTPDESGVQEDRNPTADTIGEKLDQILILMKKMDVMPKEQSLHQHPQRKMTPRSLRSQLETRMEDGSRSGPIDITEMMNETNHTDINSSLLLKDSAVKERTKAVGYHQNGAGVNGTDKFIAGTSVEESPDNLATLRQGVIRNGTDAASSTEDGASQWTSRDEKTGLLQNEITGRHSGPVDVTALLAARSAPSKPLGSLQMLDDPVESADDKGIVSVLGGKSEECPTGGSGSQSDDVINLMGLKSSGREDGLTEMGRMQQDKVRQ